MQWLARRLQIFGVHVPVGVRSPDKAIPIVNALTAYIPHFLALSASSPYWVGTDTGLASARSKVFEGLPTAGLPYQLSGWDDFERYMATLISAQTIESVREVWWDVRPHPNFGTVELRICDGLPTLYEISWACGAVAVPGRDAQRPARPRLHAAGAEGLDGPGEQVAGGAVRHRRRADRRRRRPDPAVAGAAISELVDELVPIADRLGCATELAIVPSRSSRSGRATSASGRRRRRPAATCTRSSMACSARCRLADPLPAGVAA